MKILIVTGGSLDTAYIKDYVADQDFNRVIAADSGLKYCQDLSILPTDILGDFDSLQEKNLLQIYENKGIPVRTFPTRKDFTDTELAIQYALDLIKESKEEDLAETEVFLVGATGTRLDHTLANIGLLSEFAERAICAAIVDRHNTVTMIQGPKTVRIQKEADRPFVSIIACSEQVEGVYLQGFSYPLSDYTLPAYVSLGISNELTEGSGKISIRKGKLLIIQSRD